MRGREPEFLESGGGKDARKQYTTALCIGAERLKVRIGERSGFGIVEPCEKPRWPWPIALPPAIHDPDGERQVFETGKEGAWA